MTITNTTVRNKTGLHARPAADLALLSKRFSSDISIQFGETEVNPRSLISILKAGIAAGDKLTIKVEGADEAQASKEITSFIESLAD